MTGSNLATVGSGYGTAQKRPYTPMPPKPNPHLTAVVIPEETETPGTPDMISRPMHVAILDDDQVASVGEGAKRFPVVATVNDRAIRPAVVAARGVVFGVVIAVIGILTIVLFCVGFIRVTTIAGHRIWASYLVLGLLFSIVGAILYSRRGLPPDA